MSLAFRASRGWAAEVIFEGAGGFRTPGRTTIPKAKQRQENPMIAMATSLMERLDPASVRGAAAVGRDFAGQGLNGLDLAAN
jgi:hypothetical protein